MRRRSLIPYIFLLWLLLYAILPSSRPMAAPDEYRYAEIPREMMISGDWVIPRLNGMPYFEKPVLGYWATAVSMKLFGQNAFAARLPSALGAALMALAMLGFFAGSRDWRIPPLAASMLLSSLLVVAIGTIAILDSLFTGFLCLSLLGFFRALEPSSERKAGKWLILGGSGVGLAFLIKGFLAIVIPGLVMLPYLFMTRKLWGFLRRSWIPLIWALLVAAPWSILVGVRSEFWQHFFWVEHVQRFLNPGDNQHVEALWFYLPRLVLGLVPWIGLAPLSAAGLSRIEDPADRRLGLFGLCWGLMPLLFFSLSSGKLVTYILPCIPALIVLIVLGLRVYLQGGARRFLGLPAMLEVLIGLGVLIYFFVGHRQSQPMVELIFAEPGRWAPMVAGSALCALLGLIALARGSAWRRLVLMMIAPVFFLGGLQLGLDAGLLRSPGALIEAVRPQLEKDLVLVGNGNTVQALCWEAQRTDVEVFGKATEFAYGLEHTAGRNLLDLEALKSRVDAAPAGVWILLDNRTWGRISGSFPATRILGRDRHYSLVELSPASN